MRLHRVFRLLEGFGDLADRLVFEMMEPEQEPLLGREAPLQGVFELRQSLLVLDDFEGRGALGGAARCVRLRLLIDQGNDRVALSLEAPGDGASGDAEDPGREGSFSAIRVDGREDVDEDLLSRLLGVGAIGEPLRGEAIDALEVAVVELVEGLAIASSKSTSPRFFV